MSCSPFLLVNEQLIEGKGTLNWVLYIDHVKKFNRNDFINVKDKGKGNYSWTGEFNLGNLK